MFFRNEKSPTDHRKDTLIELSESALTAVRTAEMLIREHWKFGETRIEIETINLRMSPIKTGKNPKYGPYAYRFAKVEMKAVSPGMVGMRIIFNLTLVCGTKKGFVWTPSEFENLMKVGPDHARWVEFSEGKFVKFRTATSREESDFDFSPVR
jgi:hypothetical protein